jgi:hypothetical protein
MSIDIKTRQFNTVVGDETRRVYSVSVVGPDGPVKTVQTENVKEVDDLILQSLEEHPNATINGEKTDVSPFTTEGNFSHAKPASSTPPPSIPGGSAGISNQQATPSLSDLASRSKSKRRPSKKKAVDLSGLPREKQELFKKSSRQERIDRGLIGPFCGSSMEAIPNRITALGESVVGHSPTSPAFIVCGRDRPRSSASGYGGKGHTQASSVDIVAGLGGYNPRQVDDKDNIVYTDPDFFKDSARVYISQKTDVDENFAIGKEESYFMSEAKSAVAIKADNVRIIGRESLKLVTYTDRMNSQGGEIRSFSGIHLMANNDEDGLQSIPKGENLKRALLKLSNYIEQLAKYLSGYIEYQSKYNEYVAEHTHMSPFFAEDTLEDFALVQGYLMTDIEQFSKTQTSAIKLLTNLGGFRHNFLVESGKSYINSRYNKVN